MDETQDLRSLHSVPEVRQRVSHWRAPKLSSLRHRGRRETSHHSKTRQHIHRKHHCLLLAVPLQNQSASHETATHRLPCPPQATLPRATSLNIVLDCASSRNQATTLKSDWHKPKAKH